MAIKLTVEHGCGLMDLFFLNEEVVRGMITSAEDLDLFQKLVVALPGIKEVSAQQPIPIGNELRGRWYGSSPVGMEGMQPPAHWEFEERFQNALTLDTHHLLLLGAKSVNAKIFAAELDRMFGKGFVVDTDKIKMPHFLDALGDDNDNPEYRRNYGGYSDDDDYGVEGCTC